MRVAIAGAGNVGRSIAAELVENGHQVLLVEQRRSMLKPERVPEAEWMLADACELESLQQAALETCDVTVAATGDDKVNLVVSLLAKTEFAVPRVVARVNRAENEWLFNQEWGVDVSVSKPRLLAALVEEAVSVGDLVRLMTFRQSQANLVEFTLAANNPLVGSTVDDLQLPGDAALVAILRGARVIAPTPADTLEAKDELVFVCNEEAEDTIRTVLGR
ncbi:potassium channel family protein [Haloglycomyces albus]|uniref:potassium channel family protein n=1 Tax=Haloglycomyces albus TaxID=526067 RepID=UPI00046C9E37|nr:TrkA family potassium uptake protein [Haloglycomyces albus]